MQRVMMKEVGVRRLSAQWCREWSDEENCSDVSDSLSLTIQRVQRQIKERVEDEVTRLVLDQNSSGETSTIHAVLIY